MKLILNNQVTKKNYEFTVEDSNTSRIFYSFSISLPSGITDGQYNYTLMDGEIEKSVGILQIGDFVENNNKTYTKQENGYRQYNG